MDTMMRWVGGILVALAACKSSSGGQWEDAAGVPWKLTHMKGRATVPGTSVTLTLGQDGRATGRAVNNYTSLYTRNESELKLGKIGATKKFLDSPPGAMAQESNYFYLLGQVSGWWIENTKLELLREGKPVLTFAR